jgi:hypothetical protein
LTGTAGQWPHTVNRSIDIFRIETIGIRDALTPFGTNALLAVLEFAAIAGRFTHGRIQGNSIRGVLTR